MKNDWLIAKEQLLQGAYTCVMCKDGLQYTSRERGVNPLMDWLAEGVNLQGFSAADKVVGKATAFLYVLLGVTEVYAPVMSEGAVQIFQQYNINIEAEQVVPAIRNRSNTGFCPMETAVAECKTPAEAKEIIYKKCMELSRIN